MLKLITIVAVAFLVACSGVEEAAVDIVEETVDPSPIRDVRIESGHGGTTARFFAGEGSVPLILDLHAWVGTHKGSFGTDTPLSDAVVAMGWSYLRPGLGSNATPNGCCGERQLTRLTAAVEFAKANADVSEIHIVGSSGGGYVGLCALMQEWVEAASYNLWVPISDLEAWGKQVAGSRYAREIRECTGGDPAEMRRRSPLHMSMPSNVPPVKIYAGIHDGWQGTVPVTQSVRMFNRLASETGHADAAISTEAMLRLLEFREAPEFVNVRFGEDTEVHLHAVAGNVELIVFDGAHEGRTAQVLRDLIGD